MWWKEESEKFSLLLSSKIFLDDITEALVSFEKTQDVLGWPNRYKFYSAD